MKPSLFSIFALILGVCLNINAEPTSVDSLIPGDTSEAISEKGVTLIIKTNPVGAAVYLNDSLRGLSPITAEDLDTGRHLLILKKSGYYQKKVEFRIDTIGTTELNIVLQQPGGLSITTEPSGATLFIDDKQVGVAPYSDSRLKPGEYLVRAVLTNHEPFQTKVNIKSGVVDQLKISLKLSKAYTDSLENARIESQRNRRRFSSILVIGAFVVFGIILFAVEKQTSQ
ncbi:MAG TPA: PEGA domain-containing protein [Chitinispirillaceae bacterium]|jgi:hypothetical protein|nr:PEGA domain-containing protein [Chitinispirillaceae bacterium]